jgi:pyruvate dehydrogenase E1 component alpha subunit
MQAADFARKGNGPILLEMKTYRYRGHSMSDPANYRSKEEVGTFKDKDPLTHIREKIISKAFASEEQLKEIEKKVKAIVTEAEDFASVSAMPDESELYTDVYTID